MRLLVTRPEPDNEDTAKKLRTRGCDVIVAPLLRAEPIAAALGERPWGALVVTSANAMRAIEQHPRRAELIHLPLFAVGIRTARAARALGFNQVSSANGDQSDLVRHVVAHYRDRRPLLYLAGEDRAGDLAGDLASHGVEVNGVVIYRAVKATSFPPLVTSELATAQIDGVLHYSRRSTEAYLACAEAAGVLDRALVPVHYCLSRRVAEPLMTAGAGTIRIASAPREDVLFNLIMA